MAQEVRTTTAGREKECFLAPATDIYETQNEYVLRAEMPGIAKEDLEIVLDNSELELRGRVKAQDAQGTERLYSEYTLYDYVRKFRVGEDVDRTGINAKLENGILNLILPKREESRPRRIEIAAG